MEAKKIKEIIEALKVIQSTLDVISAHFESEEDEECDEECEDEEDEDEDEDEWDVNYCWHCGCEV